MKLWQYITISVLMIAAYFAGDIGGYNAGHDEGYDFGYADGIFDEGWHAANVLNITYTDLWGGTYYMDNGVWFTTIPTSNNEHLTLSYDGECWQPEG